MKILILGSSKVAQSLACELVDEGNDVTVVSEDAAVLKNMQTLMDIRTVKGRASYPDILRSARADKMDIMIAVTESDEVNMIACQVAYSLFKVPLKIAKIRSPHYLIRHELFGNENLPIDIFLNPEVDVATSIFNIINNLGVSSLFQFTKQRLSLISINVNSNSMLFNMSWQKFQEKIIDLAAKPVAIMRKHKYLQLRSNLKLQQHDEVFLFVDNAILRQVLQRFELGTKKKVSRVIIAGGGGVGANLAKLLLQNNCNVKIIEHNKAVCASLASSMGKATVLEGDAAERDLLFQENVEGVDVFCALTSDDEDNIISSLQAKYLGAKNVIALVNNSEYMEIFSRSDVDVFVPPQQVSISNILTYIRKQSCTQAYSLCRGLSEAVCFEVLPDYARNLLGKDLKKITFPPGVICVALQRKDKLFFDLDITVQLHDSLLFFVADKNRYLELETMFD
ncbi:MAG: Trk system potassium transporter TrkA [Pseudomonadota bacterium]|nr:Trk system potassium transporter TrkA [Pseudomonadota bacterium]